MTVKIRMEETPNPNARRYVIDRPVQQAAKGRFFTSGDAGEPLVEALFGVPGVAGVLLLPNSVTINKTPGSDWEMVDPSTRSTLESYFS